MTALEKCLIIGTRGSALARRQTEMVRAWLTVPSRIEIIKTSGDRLLDVPLQGRLEKGFFTAELEQALLDGRVDLAVHSLKDLPTAPSPGLTIGAMPAREAVGDMLLIRPDAFNEGSGLLPLKAGSPVGAASLRRQALLQKYSPATTVRLLRGNVTTRVEKLRRGEYAAIVLARAGLTRLALDVAPLLSFDLNPEFWLPAPGQGALGVQVRAGDRPGICELLLELVNRPEAVQFGPGPGDWLWRPAAPWC